MRIVHRSSGWVWLFLIVVLARAALAQEVVTISGTITTHADGLPIPGAVGLGRGCGYHGDY
jgi:hypothetical protein